MSRIHDAHPGTVHCGRVREVRGGTAPRDDSLPQLRYCPVEAVQSSSGGCGSTSWNWRESESESRALAGSTPRCSEGRSGSQAAGKAAAKIRAPQKTSCSTGQREAKICCGKDRGCAENPKEVCAATGRTHSGRVGARRRSGCGFRFPKTETSFVVGVS